MRFVAIAAEGIQAAAGSDSRQVLVEVENILVVAAVVESHLVEVDNTSAAVVAIDLVDWDHTSSPQVAETDLELVDARRSFDGLQFVAVDRHSHNISCINSNIQSTSASGKGNPARLLHLKSKMIHQLKIFLRKSRLFQFTIVETHICWISVRS